MDRKTIKDSLITGFAVFAIFFGAGNLIFPAAVGLLAGDQWPAAMLAMILCGVVLPFLALVAVANTGNSWSDLCKPVGTWYDKGVFFVATVGMVILSNLPRTAATTHEVAIAPLFPSCPVWVTSVIFFALVLFFAFDENNIIDRIGKYITPLMLVFLIIIVGKGLITPLGTPEPTGQEHVFKSAFVELYYTGDLFSGLFVSTIFLTDLARKGYETQEERKKMTVKAVWVAGIASVIVYSGLLIMGADAVKLFDQGIDRTTLLAEMVRMILGKFGTIALSASAALACLSTASGLVGISAAFLENMTKKKVNYRTWVIGLCIFGAAMACIGVENIISVAAPVFMLLYPSGLAITVLGLFKKYVPNDGAFKGAVIGAVIAGIIDCLDTLGVSAAGEVMGYMPLASLGFGWILPSIIGFAIGWAVGKKETEKTH